ncbi:MAG: AAA family ATPase [Christensenellales bacterium]
MYCILVAGPPASGKSTLAARLSARLGLPMASKDELKEVLFDTLGFSSRQEKVALGVAAMALLCAFAQAQMRVGKSFILENNFEDVAKPPLQALLARYGYTPITLRMAGDPAVLYRRFLARNASPERHRGHVVNDRYPEIGPGPAAPPPTLEGFIQGVTGRGMDRFAMSGPLLEVDATDLTRVDLEAIARWLASVGVAEANERRIST